MGKKNARKSNQKQELGGEGWIEVQGEVELQIFLLVLRKVQTYKDSPVLSSFFFFSLFSNSSSVLGHICCQNDLLFTYT